MVGAEYRTVTAGAGPIRWFAPSMWLDKRPALFVSMSKCHGRCARIAYSVPTGRTVENSAVFQGCGAGGMTLFPVDSFLFDGKPGMAGAWGRFPCQSGRGMAVFLLWRFVTSGGSSGGKIEPEGSSFLFFRTKSNRFAEVVSSLCGKTFVSFRKRKEFVAAGILRFGS